MNSKNASYNGMKFTIEEDHPEVGCYLYVFKDGECIYDTLQDDCYMCQKVAAKKFGVPIERWEK